MNVLVLLETATDLLTKAMNHVTLFVNIAAKNRAWKFLTRHCGISALVLNGYNGVFCSQIQQICALIFRSKYTAASYT